LAVFTIVPQPSLDQEDHDCRRGASAAAELIVQHEGGAVDVGAYTDVEQLGDVVELLNELSPVQHRLQTMEG
jgi:hypothetical protein